MGLNTKKQGNYLSIIEGTLRKVVPEGTVGAVKRDYESSDKKIKGTKYELVYSSVSGIIKSIRFYTDRDYGTKISLLIRENNDSFILSIPVKSRFCSDLMRKLPNVDLEKEVDISPYDFVNEKGKKYKGVSITQGGKKMKNFFFNEEKKEFVEGYPVPEKDWDTMTDDERDIFGASVRKFLKEYIETNVASKLAKEKEEKVVGEEIMNNDSVAGDDVQYPEDEINPEDIPF